VTSLEIAGPAVFNSVGNIEQPIRVVISNQGGSSAGIFKVSTDVTSTNGTFNVSFTVPGQNSYGFPFTTAPVAAGGQVRFQGYLTFSPRYAGQQVSITAIADSCAGDEFQPTYCRVDERNEGNNVSAPLKVTLPRASTP
jgi:hypothetical protein